MPQQRQLHLNLNFLNAGTHAAAWRWPESDPKAFAKLDYYVEVAKLAERGTFDAVFLADFPALPERSEFRPFQSIEPTIALATIAAHTEHIGLIATASSTYNDPYNIARRFASLDHASGGRAGINIVTTADRQAAFNFGLDETVAHSRRYARAGEFAEILKGLWDSWEDDAVVADQKSGRFLDLDRIHAIHHRGENFRVRGPLNTPRTPQGRPVVVQAGGSANGIGLAAAYADAVFSVAHSLADAERYAAALYAKACSFGRKRSEILIFPGLVTIIGGTEAEARRREEELAALVPIEQGLNWLSLLFQVDASVFDPDGPLPANLKVPNDGMTTFASQAIEKARRGKLTVRQLIRSQGGGGTNHRTVVGTPEQIAADIETWFQSGAIAGFNVMPDVLPSGLAPFVDHVVPILRRRGLFREAYSGKTLRDHLGLPRPPVAPRQSAQAAARPVSAFA